MDTVGTFEMARVPTSIPSYLPPFINITLWKNGQLFLQSVDQEAIAPYIAVSTGTSKADAEKLGTILEQFPFLLFICIDVANGYSEHFVRICKKDPGKISGKSDPGRQCSDG